ncbi:MAG: 2Fe-2S iron-sulfur cluster binding domain-containing protein [Clostridiales bacterium]|jgi:ferredoxin|nr:2Fe-2S iron-sulfur cluster binding domain-containing protein [Clostridiales bacterium]
MGENTYRINVLNTGAQFLCRQDEYVLEAMKKSGCGPIHYGCFGGGCGICKMKVISGSYRVDKKMSRAHISPEEETDGFVLTCCIKPTGNLTISQI